MALPSTPALRTTNPNPARITTEEWAFVEALEALEPSTVNAGVYANKPGYHNTRANLLAQGRTGDYSIQLAADKEGPSDKSAAVDWTFLDAQKGSYFKIAKYAARMLASGKDMDDERGNYLREFYGQADGDLAVEGWDFQRLVMVSSDSSHLWHIHFSFLRKYVATWKAFDATLSILKGETVAAWRARWTPVIVPSKGLFLIKEAAQPSVFLCANRTSIRHVPDPAALIQVKEALAVMKYPTGTYTVAAGSIAAGTYGTAG